MYSLGDIAYWSPGPDVAIFVTMTVSVFPIPALSSWARSGSGAGAEHAGLRESDDGADSECPWPWGSDAERSDSVTRLQRGGLRMRATVMHSADGVRIENVPYPTVIYPSDAIVRVIRACICGSDSWPYCSMQRSDEVPRPRRFAFHTQMERSSPSQ